LNVKSFIGAAAAVAILGATASVAVLGVTPASAHHNANAQFDNSKETSVHGTLEEVRDIAPHALWKVVVLDPATKTQSEWLFAAMGNNQLRRMGIAVKTDFKPGQQFDFYFSPSRDGSKTGFITAVTISGKKYQMVKF
jgi:hypothetical protein